MKGTILGLGLIFVAPFWLAACAAWGQDYTRRPTMGATIVQCQASSSPGIIQTCLIACGSDHLDPASYLECIPSTPDQVTDHIVTVPQGGGDVCARCVNLNVIHVSEPSAASMTVADIPSAPTLIP